MSDLLGSTFSYASMVNLFNDVLETTKTFDIFLKTYSLIIILLSKLKSIPGFIPQSKLNELNNIFKLIELNLPKEVAESVLNITVKELLSAEGNYWVLKVNYNKCLENWRKEFVNLTRSSFNCPFNALL